MHSPLPPTRLARRTSLATLLVLAAIGCDLDDAAPAGARDARHAGSAPADLQADPEPGFEPTDETTTGEEPDPTPPTVFCGDGVVDVGELCDPGVPPVCGPDAMLLTCAATCQAYTLVPCLSCGNGVRDTGEQCDGLDFAGESCATLGFFAGELQCSALCELVVAGCNDCGDGSATAKESCDGADLKGQDCESLGYAAGALTCRTDCGGFDTSQCEGTSTGCCTEGSTCPSTTTLACVCAFEPACCEGPWTAACVAAADTSCGAQCS